SFPPDNHATSGLHSARVLTVRNKVQEDFKETLVKKIDAFADQLIGRNVVLELFSLDIDPSMCFLSSWLI
ncbi:hypothetical protein Tco_0248545, partial [Tanacetum coccineum]